MYDVIIVGAGPAGLTAAIYVLRDGKKVLLLEKEAIGGKIASSPRIENYPGFIKIKGSDFASNLSEQVLSLGGTIKLEEVTKIKDGKFKTVETDKETYQGKTVILASGSSYQTLKVDREEEFIGNGISFCTVCDAAFYQGEDVCVVGGANSAIGNALALSEICHKVYMIVRKDFLRGEKKQISELQEKSNVEILYRCKIIQIIGESDIEAVKVLSNDQEKILSVTGIFLAIGQKADTDYLDDKIKLSNDRYILSDENMKTNIPGIFVAGDVRDKKIRQLTTAVNDGTIAALEAIEYIQQNLNSK